MGNIVVGIIFIIGGLSGQLALIGTESSVALAGVGVVLLLVGIFQMATGGGEEEGRSRARKRGGRAGRGEGGGRRSRRRSRDAQGVEEGDVGDTAEAAAPGRSARRRRRPRR